MEEWYVGGGDVPIFSHEKRDGEHHIKWPINTIDRVAYVKLRDVFIKSRDYGPITSGKERQIAQLAREFNIDEQAVISIRNVVLKEKIISNYHRMNHKIRMIAAEYKSGDSIIELSRKHDFPPVNLLRGIFLELGYRSDVLYALFSDRAKATDCLRGRDIIQYEIAQQNDAETYFNQAQVAKIAAHNEALFIDFLKSLDIKMKTQDDLVEEQVSRHGRAIITPDVLFMEPVYINGALVKWIDFKNYVGTTAKFLLRSNLEQAARYTAKYGIGALAYRHPFVDGLKIGDTIILNCNMLTLNFIDKMAN